MNDSPFGVLMVERKESRVGCFGSVDGSDLLAQAAATAALLASTAVSAAIVAAQFQGINSARRERGQPLAILSMMPAR